MSTTFCAILWPAQPLRGHFFRKSEVVYEYRDEFKSEANPCGVGPELGVVQGENGTKISVRFADKNTNEDIARGNLAPAIMGPLYPEAEAYHNKSIYKFVRLTKGGAFVTTTPSKTKPAAKKPRTGAISPNPHAMKIAAARAAAAKAKEKAAKTAAAKAAKEKAVVAAAKAKDKAAKIAAAKEKAAAVAAAKSKDKAAKTAAAKAAKEKAAAAKAAKEKAAAAKAKAKDKAAKIAAAKAAKEAAAAETETDSDTNTSDEERVIAKHLEQKTGSSSQTSENDSNGDSDSNSDFSTPDAEERKYLASEDAKHLKFLDSEEQSEGEYNSSEPLSPMHDNVENVEKLFSSDSDADANDNDSGAVENNVEDGLVAGGFMSNLAEVLQEHGIDAKHETNYSDFIVRVAQIYDTYGTSPPCHNSFVS